MLFGIRSFRGMQAKHLALLALASCATAIFIFIHLEGEISRLDGARIKLERTVAKLQLENIDYARRRSPQYIQELPSQSKSIQEDSVIIYNRVPKTGSTSFAGIAYDLCIRNNYNVLHLNVTKNSHIMSIGDQMRFANNITLWNSKKPALYHGHLAFLDFSRFGLIQKPIYINIIRNPLDRLVSYYYFLRHGDNYRPHLKRRKSGNRQSFDECVAVGGNDCDPENLWLQIPFFCGHAADCWIPGNKWALDQAKYNLVNHFLVVGVTEELGDFVAVLEAALPRYFRGATALYNSGQKSHLRKTFHKIPPKDETISRIQESTIWKMENDFYEFAKEQFHFVKKWTFDLKNGFLKEKKQQFMYEKIRPR